MTTAPLLRVEGVRAVYGDTVALHDISLDIADNEFFALLAFTLSLDEFVIAFFTTAPTQPTLPIVIYSMVRFGVTPEVNALASLLLLVSIVTVIAAQRLTRLTGSPK